jgi:hypothetical protein
MRPSAGLKMKALAEEKSRLAVEACPNRVVMFDGARGLRSAQAALGMQ